MKVTSALVPILILLASCSPQTQKPAPTATPIPAPTAASPAEVIVKTGVLTFVAGEVEAETGGTWKPVDTGDTVSVDSKVRTGKKSACDIQFAQLGVVHLAESTDVSLKTIVVSSKKKAVDLELLTGSVTAKVSKLLGNDRFQVKTDTVVCGVRGTRFVVTKKEGTPTTIGVAEGSVALLPPTYDAQKLDDLSASPDQKSVVDAVRASILQASTTVTVGSQAVVTKASLQKSAEAIAKIEDSLAQLPTPVPAAPGSAPAPVVVPDTVTQALQDYQKAAPGPGTPVPQAQTLETKKSLTATQDLQVKEVLPQVAPPVSAPSPTSTPAPQAQTSVAPAPVLASPRPIAPVGGTSVDIKTQATIRFSWRPVPGATGYEVNLFKDKEKTPVKSWTTEDSSVVLDRFTGLQEGSFRWEVVAEKNGDSPLKSAPSSSVFRIVKGTQLSAPSLDPPSQD